MGQTIRTYRTRLGFTQNALASALLVSPQAVSKWERGENAPDIALLPSLAEVLGVSTDTLLGSHYRENRTVEATVVYADMEGFGPLARDLEPADLAISLNTFFYPLTEHLMRFDGIPIQYVGDEVLAFFTGEGHRLRAFQAVFAAREASPRGVRFSVATGPVWMGSLGHPLHAGPALLGTPVNVASWLQGWAKTNSASGVAAAESAVASLTGRLTLGKTETASTWGTLHPVQAWEILGVQ